MPECPVPAFDIERVDPITPYVSQLERLIDRDRLTASPIRVVIDSMHGAARGLVSRVLESMGVAHTGARTSRDVTFGGHAPEPLERNLAPLRHAMQAAGRRPELRTIGVATDGDGDRISAMDERGTFIDPHRTYALILRYLVEERGWRGPVVLSSSVSDLIRRMARTYELEIIETPIGFKYATEHLVRRDILMAGEESGGLAVRRYLPERDGVYSSLLLAELLAASEEAPSDLVKSLHARFGPQVYRRADLEIESPLDAVNRVIVEQLGTFAGHAVREIETLDGAKLRFKDGWLLFRASGTEPILRT